MPVITVRAFSRALVPPVPRSHLPTFIAATAESSGLILATRDATPFEAMGVRVIDPWAC